jgi:hypothetical protein
MGAGRLDDRAARDASQLTQSLVEILPLMHGDECHRRVNGLFIERQLFGYTMHRRREVPGTLGTHRLGGFDRDDVSALRFVRARAGADVENGSGIAKRAMHVRGDSWIGATRARVAFSDRSVVDVACQIPPLISPSLEIKSK